MTYRLAVGLLIALIPWLASAPPLGAQPGDPSLLADIHQAGASPYSVSELVRLGEVAVFVQSPSSGDELWVSNGTDAGTRELDLGCSSPDCRIALGPGDGSRAFLTFAPGDGSVQLGVTDGTSAGTRILTEFDPTEGPSSLSFSDGIPAFVGDLLLFGAADERGRELWISDGTVAGTRLLMEFDPGPESGLVQFGASTGAYRIFVATDGQRFGLWRTDGTESGTIPLEEDFFPDPFVGRFLTSVALGNVVLFFPDRQTSPGALWITDGTAAGTRPLRDLGSPDLPPVQVSQFIAGETLAFFLVGQAGSPPHPPSRSVWRSDGTAEGTFPVVEADDFGLGLSELQTVHQGRLFFSWDDGTDGLEPWISDGTLGGTDQVADVCPGLGSSNPRFLFTLGPDIVYRARDCERRQLMVSEVEMWSVLGGPGPDLCPGPCSSDPELLAVGDDGSVYLTADRGLGGRELWHLGPEGDLDFDVVRITDFPNREPFRAAPRPNGFVPDLTGTALPGFAIFFAVDPVTGLGLYRTGGTAQGTELVQTLAPAANAGSNPRELTRVGDEVVFLADDGFDVPGLWTTDFTNSGTRPVEFDPESLEIRESPFDFETRHPYGFRDLQTEGSRLFFWIEPADGLFIPGVLEPGETARPFAVEGFVGIPADGSDPSEPPPYYLVGDKFFAFSSPINTQLFVLDGTPEGTRLFSVPVDSPFTPAAPLGSRLVFAGTFQEFPSDPGPALYSHDGMDEGSRMIRTLPGAVGSMTAAGSLVYFDILGPEPAVWLTDGTTPGTRPLPAQGIVPGDAVAIIPDGNRIFLFADATGRRFLWVSNGTAQGTRLLTEANPEFTEPRTDAWAVLDRELFWLERGTGTQPLTLHGSDGTVAGTGPRDLLPADVEPLELHAAGGRLVIVTRRSFEDPDVELWVSDGTPTGTHLLSETYRRSSVGDFEGLGGRVIFAADGGEVGTELWGFTTVGETGPCVPGPGTLCLTQDRFRVEVTWRDPRSGDTGTGVVLPGTTLDDSGFFWFFDPDNVELVVKVLDARPVNGFFWVFTASLTDVERRITITDTVTGHVNVYTRDAGDPTGHIDVTAF